VLAESALPTAGRLCEDLGAPLHLVRVVDPGTALDLMDVGLFSMLAYESTLADLEADATLELMAFRQREAGRGAAITSEVRTGSPATELLAILRPDDLVVMTSHGAGGTLGWCISGVTEKLLRRGPAPIVILHQRADALPFAATRLATPAMSTASPHA
jgi:nucleotide-binding universal stress UspA family protein